MFPLIAHEIADLEYALWMLLFFFGDFGLPTPVLAPPVLAPPYYDAFGLGIN